MESNVKMSQLIKDFLQQDEGYGQVEEELRVALNEIIARHKLHCSVVISMLARMSAGYIHFTQEYYDKLQTDVVVEEDFQNFLTATLTSLDMNDVAGELDRMKNKELN